MSPLVTISRELSVSAQLTEHPIIHNELSIHGRVQRATLRDGLDIVVWEGNFPQPLTTHRRDDWGRVQFCCALRGRAHYSLVHGNRRRHVDLRAGMNCISYAPNSRCRATHAGAIETVTIAVRPDILHELVPNLDTDLTAPMGATQYCEVSRSDAQMNAIAHSLVTALRSTPPSTLWLLGQSLVLVSLALAAHEQTDVPTAQISQSDRHKLLQARDYLLADLSAAPTIAKLARETGLGVLKLKRGFRELFQHSVYGLFQQERMHEARRRLLAGDSSVMVVASDMGYANASHFATAFQKQFGIKPSALKQRR